MQNLGLTTLIHKGVYWLPCMHCDNEATHECDICMEILCRNCCPHPRWYRRLIYWYHRKFDG